MLLAWWSVAAGAGTVTVGETGGIDAPIELTWALLATAEGVASVRGAIVDQADRGVVLDEVGEAFGATWNGRHGDFRVADIDGPRWIQLAWLPDDGSPVSGLDLALREVGEGTELRVVARHDDRERARRRDLSRALKGGIEAFRARAE